MIDKNRIFVDTVDRTFETRLLFIEEIFSDKYDQDEILASCINFKLNNTYKNYTDELRVSMMNLIKKDPIKVLKRIKK